MTFGPKIKELKKVELWLWGFLGLVVFMIMLGGATRLTKSGLSITTWDPITGFIPPLSEQEWMFRFKQYQLTPEYRFINEGMALKEFKFIFLMEFWHRFIARFLVLYLAIPGLYFWHKRILTLRIKKGFLTLLFLLGVQGFLGWYMVQSGLEKEPAVSHYRLTLHLFMAFIVLAVTLRILFLEKRIIQARPSHSAWAKVNLILVSLTVLYGAFVAGLKAGLIYNTFPLMGDTLIPKEMFFYTPFWKNFLENHATIQFTHRLLAFLVLTSTLFGYIKRWAPFHLVALVSSQVILGIFTLLYHVPVILGTLHQGLASVLFSAMYWVYLKQQKHRS